MGKKRAYLAAALLLGLLGACGGGGSSIPDRPANLPPAVVDCGRGSNSVSGRFLAPNGTTPVAGAFVYARSGGCWAGTDQQGSFTFNGLPSGATLVHAEKGFFKVDAQAQTGTTVTLQIDPAQVRIAYVSGSFDRIQDVVTRIGFTPIEIQASRLSSDLSEFDAVLLNCGINDTVAEDPTVASRLRAYVEGGGVLYASDFSEAFMRHAFPDDIAFYSPDPRLGKYGLVAATVVDEGLKRALGKDQAQINFNLPGWAIIDSVPATTRVLVRGPVSTLAGEQLGDRPFAVQFVRGRGRVLYTSFHHEAQTTADMDVLLEQMLLGL